MCLKYHDIELLVAKYSQNKEPEFHFSSPQIKTEKIAKEARHVYDCSCANFLSKVLKFLVKSFGKTFTDFNIK